MNVSYDVNKMSYLLLKIISSFKPNQGGNIELYIMYPQGNNRRNSGGTL